MDGFIINSYTKHRSKCLVWVQKQGFGREVQGGAPVLTVLRRGFKFCAPWICFFHYIWSKIKYWFDLYFNMVIRLLAIENNLFEIAKETPTLLYCCNFKINTSCQREIHSWQILLCVYKYLVDVWNVPFNEHLAGSLSVWTVDSWHSSCKWI